MDNEQARVELTYIFTDTGLTEPPPRSHSPNTPVTASGSCPSLSLAPLSKFHSRSLSLVILSSLVIIGVYLATLIIVAVIAIAPLVSDINREEGPAFWWAMELLVSLDQYVDCSWASSCMTNS